MNGKWLLLITLGLVLILAVPALVGCGQQPDTDKTIDELDGSQWKLITLDDNQLVTGSYISLYFRKGTIWGCAGINLYSANYSVENRDTLNFSDGMMTLLGGPENIIQQEKAYVKYFQGATSYRIKDNHLEISNPSNLKPLIFERLPEYPMDPADLVGTKWQLISMNGDSVPEDLSITLDFESDSLALGQAGCFAYSLPYEADGDNIWWGINSRRTGKLSPELEEYALRYTDSLLWAASYRLVEDRLEIFTSEGDTLIYQAR